MTRIVPEFQEPLAHKELDHLPTAPPASSSRSMSSQSSHIKPEDYAQPFCDFLSNNPTVFHAVDAFASELKAANFQRLSERDEWVLQPGGKYFVERNGSSLIAFAVGADYRPGNGVAMIGGHVDAITTKLKPISSLPTKQGFVQLGVAPYASGLNKTWWDRDLGIAGKVLVKESNGKIVTRLVDLNQPIARVPTLAEHFGAVADGPFNKETQMVPIIGLDNSDLDPSKPKVEEPESNSILGGGVKPFASTQPPRLVKAVASKLGLKDGNDIVSWELELYDIQGAQLGGLDKEFIFGGRIDDKLCSWSAMQALLASSPVKSSGIVKCVGVFDDEEIGSLLRQGAHGNFLPSTVERIVESLSQNNSGLGSANLLSRTYANSFLVSADVTHAVNPNFLEAYLPNHMPRLNVGVSVSAGSNGHMTTDGTSIAFIQQVAKKCDCTLQVFHIRNDVREGGTIGPMLSSAMGVRAIDVGEPQLSMHSIRATTGALDPGLGVKLFKGFFDHYEAVDAQFH